MGRPKRQYPLGKYRLWAGKHPDKSKPCTVVLEYTWNRQIFKKKSMPASSPKPSPQKSLVLPEISTHCQQFRTCRKYLLLSHMETNEIVLYQPNETMKLEVRLENETVWLTQQQIADLFGTKRPAITKHLSNIFKSGELEEEITCSIL